MLQKKDDNCFVCGGTNPLGLRLAFVREEPGASALYTPESSHIGYHDIIHGGIITALLDEAMVYAAGYATGKPAATAEINVRFITPLRVGQTVMVTSVVERETRKIIYCSAKAVLASDGSTIATATARLML